MAIIGEVLRSLTFKQERPDWAELDGKTSAERGHARWNQYIPGRREITIGAFAALTALLAALPILIGTGVVTREHLVRGPESYFQAQKK